MVEIRTERKSGVGKTLVGLGEAMAWGVLIALSLLSLNGAVVVVGLMLLIVPGLLLVLFPNLLMVLVLLQPARLLWRWTRIAAVAAAALPLSPFPSPPFFLAVL